MLNGIDVSNWQQNLNVSNVPCDFVICKATEGLNYVNPSCDVHYQQALKSNKLLGTYHFAKGLDAIKEADFYVQNIKGYIGKSIMVLDFEDKNVMHKGVSWAENWLWRVHEITGIWPMIYINQSIAQSMNWNNVSKNCGLWLAKYPSNNVASFTDCTIWKYGKLNYFNNIAIWQYSSKGRLAGYNGDLDLNHAFMTKEAWEKYASGTKTKSDDVLENDKYKVTIEVK